LITIKMMSFFGNPHAASSGPEQTGVVVIDGMQQRTKITDGLGMAIGEPLRVAAPAVQ
jgi:hypothetical protein